MIRRLVRRRFGYLDVALFAVGSAMAHDGEWVRWFVFVAIGSIAAGVLRILVKES